MNVQVIYCNHQTAELDLREQLAFSTAEQLNRAYGTLRANFPESELVVLSTCNRVELYVAPRPPRLLRRRELPPLVVVRVWSAP